MSEVIIFWILLSLVLGYFWGLWLWVNKEVAFKEKVEREIELIKEKVEENNEKHHISTWDLKYKIERVVGYNGKIKALQYKLIITDEKWNKLTKDEIDKILKEVYASEENNDEENNTTGSNENNSPYFAGNLLVYYWYPSVINWSAWDINKAESEFSKYKIVVLGNGLEYVDHPDYDNTKQIIEDLKWITQFYGYIPLVDGGNMDEEKMINAITAWKNMGVDWIFIDEAWFDYWQQYVWTSIDDYKLFLKWTYDYAKLLGLWIIFNAWNAEDVVDNLPLTEDDTLFIEDYYYWDWEKALEYQTHVENYLSKIDSLTVKPKLACIATAVNDNQDLVNEIRDDIWTNMLSNCNYSAIQDDYWTDANATVVVPTN